MRTFLPLVLLVCITGSPLYSQTTPSDVRNTFIRRLIKEKVRVPLDELENLSRYHTGHIQGAGMDEPFQTEKTIGSRSGESVVHDDEKAESEVHAVINPTDTSNVIVAAILQDPSNFLDPVEVTVYFTRDFGSSWQSSSIPFNPNPTLGFAIGGGDPVLAFDQDGTAYLSWLTFTLGQSSLPLKLTLYLATSSNQGETWSPPVIIEQGAASVEVLTGGQGTGALVDKQWMAMDKNGTGFSGNLYVSYTKFEIVDSVTTTANILVNTKSPANPTFSPAVQVNQNTYSFAHFSSIDVDPQGIVHVTFMAGNSNNDVALYHARSEDGGASFQAETMVSPVFFPGLLDGSATDNLPGMPDDRLYPCPHVKAGTTPGLLYMTWSASGLIQKETPGFDVWLAKSADGGLNWSLPIRVNQDLDPHAQQYYPALTVSPNGTLCISYYDRTQDPNGTNTNYVLTYSTDAGATFSSPALASSAASDFSKIGSLNGGFGIGEYTQVVATDYHAIPVWADGRPNNGDIDIYAAVLPLSDQFSSTGEIGTITDAFAVRLPNPADGQIRLQVTFQKPATNWAIRIFTTDGKLVFLETSGSGQQSNTLNRNIPLAPGLYLCTVETEYGFKIKRVFVQ
ncbi:MAG: T9SS type A sorting domain-containing protein [Bacteroidetes bacterium]|nr:MAG: T9SS type A sorting domain-containing protein [Bacteroidota bacterium]